MEFGYSSRYRVDLVQQPKKGAGSKPPRAGGEFSEYLCPGIEQHSSKRRQRLLCICEEVLAWAVERSIEPVRVLCRGANVVVAQSSEDRSNVENCDLHLFSPVSVSDSGEALLKKVRDGGAYRVDSAL